MQQMGSDWKVFYRLSDSNHLLEARKADGGEHYGHAKIKEVAKKDEWICRNPENGHTWVISDEGMMQLYRPVDKNNRDWDSLIESQRNKNYKETKEKTKKTSLSFDAKESGPLFFGHKEENQDCGDN